MLHAGSPLSYYAMFDVWVHKQVHVALGVAGQVSGGYLQGEIQHRWLVAVNEMPHAVVAIQRGVCCSCALATLNSQPAILKSLLIVASWAGCKLLEQIWIAEKLRCQQPYMRASAVAVQDTFRATAT